MQETVDDVLSYARSYLGCWYRWGGNSRLTGLDCSGFVCDVLRMPGVIPLRGDFASSELLTLLLESGAERVGLPIPRGAVLFFGTQGKPTHVSIALNEKFMIESAGGDHTTTSYDAAAAVNACVKISLISNRRNFICAVLPKYG